MTPDGPTCPTNSLRGAIPGSAGCPGGALRGLAKCTTSGLLWPPLSKTTEPSKEQAASASAHRLKRTIAQPRGFPSLPLSRCKFLTLPYGVKRGNRSSSLALCGIYVEEKGKSEAIWAAASASFPIFNHIILRSIMRSLAAKVPLKRRVGAFRSRSIRAPS